MSGLSVPCFLTGVFSWGVSLSGTFFDLGLVETLYYKKCYILTTILQDVPVLGI